MSNDPYSNKPPALSEANAWHELSFQISIDQPVNWDNVDLRKWAQTVAKFTAMIMAKSSDSWDDDEDDNDETKVIKTLIMSIKASRVTFVTDNELHNLIDEFDGDE